MIGDVWDPNFDGLTSGLRTIQVSTRSGHEMVLDLQQRPAQHGHRRGHTCNETENGRVVLQVGPIKNGEIANYSLGIITPYERNSLSAGIGKYSVENLTIIDVAEKIFSSNSPWTTAGIPGSNKSGNPPS